MKRLVAIVFAMFLLFGSVNAVWANNTYPFCRNIDTLTEFNGVTILNEPVNHGKGIQVDTSGWANKPHINGFAIYNAPCDNGGSLVDTELVANTTTASQIDTASFLFMVNLTPLQSTNYSLYFSPTDVGKPLPSTTDLATSISGNNRILNISSFIGGQLDITRGGIMSMTYYSKEYGQAAYPANTPTFYNNATGDYFGYPGATLIGTVTCSLDYDGMLKKSVVCSNTATTATLSYNIYRGGNFIEIIYKNGEGDWGMRQDFQDSARFRYNDDTDAFVNSSEILFTNAHSVRGVLSIRLFDSAYAPAPVPIIVVWNNSKGHNAFSTVCCSGGNVMVNLWTFDTPIVRKQNETKEARYIFVNQTDLSDAVTDVSMLNASRQFNESIGSTATFGAQQQMPNPIPQWFSLQRNVSSPVIGQAVLFSAAWTADVGLFNYIFEFDNGNGTLQNFTRSFTGTENTSNETMAVQFGTARYRFYGNSTSGDMNATTQVSFAVLDATAPQFSSQQPVSGSTFTLNENALSVDILLSAFWTDNIALSQFIFEQNSSGSFVNTTVSASGTSNFSNYTLTVSGGAVNFSFRIWGVDSSSNANVTPFSSVLVFNPPSTYQNIDLNEAPGFTALVIVKGLMQIGAKTVDVAAAPNGDYVNLLVAGLLVAAIGVVILIGSGSVQKAKKII